MKKKLLNSMRVLLVAAGLCVGANAWGEGWSLDFVSLANTFNQDKGQVNLSGTSAATIGGTDMRTITYGASEPYSEFNNNFVVQSGTSWLLRNSNRGLYMSVNGTRSFGCLSCTKDQIITIVTDGKSVSAATNVTLKSSESNTYVFTVNTDGNVKLSLANYGILKSITVEDPSATAVDYTVKYVDSEGTEIKNHATYSGEPGEDAVIYSTDKAKIKYNGVNYCYTSDDSDGKTIASDGSTVVTITFHKAATYNYTINAKYGDYVLNTAAGSSEEEDAVTYVYNKYYNYNGTLVQKLASSNSYYVKFTPDADAYVKNDAYSLSDVSDVIFFSEAEDIATLTTKTSQYLSDRFSGGEGAFAESSDKVVVTLPAGTYKLTAKIMGTFESPSTFTFKAGENTIWESSTSAQTFYANGEITGSEFTLDAETDIVLVSNTGNGSGSSSKVMNLLDYFYIQKVSTTNEVIGTADYTTAFNGQNKATTINKGQTINLAFKNYGGSSQWLNWIVRFYTTGLDNTLRADNFVLGDAESTNSKRSVKLNDTDVSDWTTFTANMQDATVNMTISYTAAGMFSISATAVGGGNTYTHSYSYNTALTDAINLQLGVDHSWLEITSYEVENPTTVSVTLPSTSVYGSLPSSYGLDFSSVDGLTAYVATATTTEAVTLTSVSELPANSGMILKGTAGATYSIPVKADATFAGTNLLSAAVSATPIDANTAYILQGGQFHLVTAASKVPAGKAYLLKSNVPSNARALAFTFGDEASGIKAIDNLTISPSDNCYDLSGRKIAKSSNGQMAKGLYIVNGKKVIIK